MSLPADTLSWFRAKQSLFLLLHTASLAQNQQIPILVFGLNRLGLKPMIYHTQGVHWEDISYTVNKNMDYLPDQYSVYKMWA